jgi:hypothetical protein
MEKVRSWTVTVDYVLCRHLSNPGEAGKATRGWETGNGRERASLCLTLLHIDRTVLSTGLDKAPSPVTYLVYMPTCLSVHANANANANMHAALSPSVH